MHLSLEGRDPRRTLSPSDATLLDHWATTFKRMSVNGVRVHIPADHSDAAADNRGYVLELKRVGDQLMALCQFIGADALRDASRNQVSIGVAPKFVDGKGRTYRDAIVHVALTPVPVVPGQGAFIPAEAFSTGSVPAGVLTLAAAQFQRRATMAQTMLPCSEECLAALHDLVPGLTDAPDEQKLEYVLQHLQKLSDDSDQANLRLAERDRRIDELSLLTQSKPPLDPGVRDALFEAVKSKRDLCVSRGALMPAVADSVLAALMPQATSIVSLSHEANDAAEPDATLALSIFTALADNRPLPPGQRTGSQSRGLMPLARNVPGETAPQGPPLYEKMAAMANGKSVQL